MGRGSTDTLADASARGGVELIQPGPPPDIGSEAHRSRLLSYARTKARRKNISLRFTQSCRRCQHHLDDHDGGQACKQDDCQCPGHISCHDSHTDMQGNIAVSGDTPTPPEGSAAEREICIRGLLRHELWHEIHTDKEIHRQFVQELQRLSGDKQEITANQLKTLWNILEDGMIETRGRATDPGAYSYISGMNKISPRVGKDRVVDEEFTVPDPGYVPEDADGNPLTVKDGQVIVPAGTKLSPWGKKPLSPHQQMEAALLAASVPEFEPGDLHPKVEEALEECQEHIDAAIRGNTADCVARAYAVQGILRKHDLLREDLTDEEREALEKLAEQLAQGMASAPEMDPNAPPQQGGQGAMNGIPMPVPGQAGMGGELSDAVGDDSAQGGGGSGDEEDGENQAANGGGARPAQPKPADQGSGAGDKDGKDGKDKSQGDGDGDEDGDEAAEKNQAKPLSAGGFEEGGGYRPDEPLPQEAASRDNKKGSVDDSQLSGMLDAAKRDLAGDKANQTRRDNAAIRSGRIEGDDWSLPGEQQVTPQREMRGNAERALPDEQGDLSKLGNQLAAQLKRIKTQARAPKRYRKRGKLDTRRFPAALAGNKYVMKKPGTNKEVSVALDISIDRSGSVTYDHEQNTNQYRMAKMFANAARETKIPTTIYGWDGSGWGAGTHHYAYKEAHSNDLTAVDALFQTGGGGTPTAEGVRFSLARLTKRKEKKKIMVIITDGEANDISAAREQVETARRQGVRVIGMAFRCNPDSMDDQFGRNNWVPIEEYTDAPRVIGAMIRKIATGPGARE